MVGLNLFKGEMKAQDKKNEAVAGGTSKTGSVFPAFGGFGKKPKSTPTSYHDMLVAEPVEIPVVPEPPVKEAAAPVLHEADASHKAAKAAPLHDRSFSNEPIRHIESSVDTLDSATGRQTTVRTYESTTTRRTYQPAAYAQKPGYVSRPLSRKEGALLEGVIIAPGEIVGKKVVYETKGGFILEVIHKLEDGSRQKSYFSITNVTEVSHALDDLRSYRPMARESRQAAMQQPTEEMSPEAPEQPAAEEEKKPAAKPQKEKKAKAKKAPAEEKAAKAGDEPVSVTVVESKETPAAKTKLAGLVGKLPFGKKKEE